MEKLDIQRRHPFPVNPDSIRGFLVTRLCTDIIAPELMETDSTEIYSFKLYQAPTAGVNKPEPGYPAHSYDDSAFTSRARYTQR